MMLETKLLELIDQWRLWGHGRLLAEDLGTESPPLKDDPEFQAALEQSNALDDFVNGEGGT